MISPIRVAIVDDHAIVRQGLRTLLTNISMDVVGEAISGEEAIELAQACEPDVMLLDIRMKQRDGLSVLPDIKAVSPKTEIIILTTYSNPTYFAEAIRNGASGYLLKDSEPDDIIEAIQSAAAHSHLFDPLLLNMVIGGNYSSPKRQAVDPLSERERDVLKLMAKGLTNAAIAGELQVSVTTIKTHVTHILRKLDVNDRTQAVLVAMRHNLVE